MLLGFRGSGKTTQGTRLAEKYNLLQVSSGAIYTEGKKPFIVLPDILKQHFGPSGSGKYNGVLLDRFIAASEMDAYYVTYCLRSVGMPIPMVFFLDVDPDVGMERASERRDNKDTKNSYWRLVEQRVQLTAVETIFRPSGCVTCIDCNRLSEEDAFAEIVGCVESQFPRWPPCHALIPPNPFKDSAPVFRLVDDFAVYEPLAREVHRVIDSRGRTTSAPLSTIGGYVDRSNFTDKHKRNLLTIEQVTMKIDGQRFLVALDRRRGAMAFPFMFSCCYQIDELFAGAHFAPLQADGIAPLPDSLKCTSDIEVLLDTEVLLDPFTHKPVIYVIDTIFFYGERVAQIRFEERYKRLTQWFREMHERADSASAVAQLSVVLKTYVPINELGTLLPRLEDAPVPIDGIVFQPNDMYHYAQDKRLLKWKPKELCTADFRLSDATPVSGGCKFSLLVSYVGLGGKSEEVPFPLAEGFIDSDSLASNAVGNSSIVELSLRSVENVNGKLATQWVFSRDRSDKPAPNRYDVVSQIIELEHLTYPELVSLCAGVNYVGAYKH